MGLIGAFIEDMEWWEEEKRERKSITPCNRTESNGTGSELFSSFVKSE